MFCCFQALVISEEKSDGFHFLTLVLLGNMYHGKEKAG